MNRQMIAPQLRQKIWRKSGRLILRLLDNQVLKGLQADMTEHEVLDLCLVLPDILMTDSPLLELNLDSSIIVIGDIYAQYGHLVRIFESYGHPPGQRYLFLGNYINQGNRMIETIALLFAYKIRFPKSIYLLRGKHECERLGKAYGLYDECLKRFSRRLWNGVISIFSYLPSAAIIDDTIFCVHSGLSPMFQHFDIRGIDGLKTFIKKSITLPDDVTSNRLLTHFVWSDPDQSIGDWEQNPVGQGYLYGQKVVEDFCERFGIRQIIRSSEMVQEGCEFFECPRLLTIFSAPDFMEFYANKGVLVWLSKSTKELDIRSVLKILTPIVRLRCKQTLRMNMTLNDVWFQLGYGPSE